MNSIDLLKRLHRHRAWVNANLLSAAANLPDQKLRSPYPIGQGSIWKSLVHMHAAEYVWLETLLGDESPLFPGDVRGKLPGNQEGSGAISDFGDLQTRWSDLERRWLAYLDSLSPESLEEIVYKTPSIPAFGDRSGTRRGDILLHVCTHAHYTAAQVVNMLRQAGIEKLPETMLISLARREAVG